MRLRFPFSLLSTIYLVAASLGLLGTGIHAESRDKLMSLLSNHPTGYLDPKIRGDFEKLLREYEQGEGKDNPDDVLFKIGSSVFGIVKPGPESLGPFPHQEGDNDPNACIVGFDYMKQFMKDVFMSYGIPSDRAETCADVLIEADKRGIDSHGLGRLKPIYCDRMDQGILQPNPPIEIIKETDTTAFVEGNLGLGLYIGPYCMKLAIEKAKKHGVGFVVVRRSTHYGIAGYYATMATDAGCIGWTGTNARPSIAPTFGVEPMLGTNPLTFGIPTDEEFPFVIDCATSINQRGKIEKYARDGVDTPKGVVVDHQGLERTDTEGILKDMVMGKCALNPMGGAGDKTAGYKGYSWATVVELLSTAFQSGPFGEGTCGVDRKTGKKIPMPLGHYFLAIDIESICPLDTFKTNAGNLLRAIRESKKSPRGPNR